ncbi:hypothetical protein HYT25_03010 [Candidatus Pacearchaeota archaeon]|nr:hypothetical protein [Candidatus Pacearchaeota archaeon]
MVVTLDSLFKKLARSHRNNGRGITSEQLRDEGMETFAIYMKKLLGKKRRIILTEEEVAKKFYNMNLVRTFDEGLEVCKTITVTQEFDYEKRGFIYLERVTGRVAIGYRGYR